MLWRRRRWSSTSSTWHTWNGFIVIKLTQIYFSEYSLLDIFGLDSLEAVVGGVEGRQEQPHERVDWPRHLGKVQNENWPRHLGKVRNEWFDLKPTNIQLECKKCARWSTYISKTCETQYNVFANCTKIITILKRCLCCYVRYSALDLMLGATHFLRKQTLPLPPNLPFTPLQLYDV